MGWLITLLVLVGLAVLPLGIRVGYDSTGLQGSILAGPVRLKVYPLKKKGDKPDKPKKKTQQPQTEPAKPKEPKPKQGGSLTQFLPLVRLLLELLTEFRRKLRVNHLELNLILGGGDPCDLAVNYGKACAAMGNLWPRLEEAFVIKKRDVQIQCDFEASETLVTARLDVTITLGRLISMGVWHGFRIIREFLRIKNQGKGGAAI
jgi:hypothetical protein